MTVPATTPPPPPPPGARPAPQRASLRREPGVAGGVCAGLGTWLRIDPIVLRVVFLVASAAGGIGILAYVLLWAIVPRDRTLPRRAARTDTPSRRRSRGSAEVALGIGLLVLSALLLFRAWGLWVGDQVAWPLVLVSVGAAVLWRQTQTRPDDAGADTDRATDAGPGRTPWPAEAPAPGIRTDAGAGERRAVAASSSMSTDARRRALLGVGLILGGALVFLGLTGTLAAARDVVLTVVVVIVAGGLILAPLWVRLWRGLSAERSERIRSQERAEVAAHLHDSVLQTLALVQTNADDPRSVALLARRQERDLRAWLNGQRPGDAPTTLAAAMRAAAAEVEDDHAAVVEVVTVGDRPLDPDTEALVAATREALVNAARHAGGGSPPSVPVALFVEVSEGRVEVFVRDRGAGFDLAAIPADRRGVRESIVGRMERHGGRAEIRSSPGSGTEVELVLESGS